MSTEPAQPITPLPLDSLVEVSPHRTSVGRGSAGKYSVSCDSCDFLPAFTSDPVEAEQWAQEHTRHPDRDVSGIYAFDRWRVINGINHAFPFDTAACGANRPETRAADETMPICETCEAKVPAEDDIFGTWSWKNWRMVDGMNHAVPFGFTTCGAGQPEVLRPDRSLPLCPVCERLAPSDR